jgi:PKD repeat protein
MGESISVEVGELVNFDASGSFAYCFNGCEECCSPSPQTMQYLWDFDDGRYSANKMCTHVFQQPGTYQVSLMVDTFGFPYFNNFMYDWDYIEVVVVEQGQPLAANADGGNLGGYETIIEVPVTFHGSASGGKAPYYYSWDFGDGTSTQITSKDAATVQHSYYVPGTYTVTLTVMDSNGDRSTDTSTVLVHDVQELVVNVGGSTHVVEGDVASFTSQVSGGDIPYSYHWDFGDGVISNIANPTHVYESSGMYTVTLTVTDGRDVQKIKTRTVTVSPTEISEVEISNVKSGLFLSAIIDSDAEVAWSIDIDGLVLFGGHADGTAQGNTQIKLPFSLGFGKVDITITAGSTQKQYTATMFGPFLLHIQEA